MKKISLFLACVFIFNLKIQAQSAGNSLLPNSRNGTVNSGNSNFIPYNSPRGVNLNANSPVNDFTSINAGVLINIQATSYVAVLSITQVGDDVFQTDSLMDVRLNNVFTELAKAGIPIENTHVDFISMLPTYEFEMHEKRYSKTMNEVPTGFEMKKNIHVRFAEHDRLNDLITAAAKAEIYDLVKIDYNVGDMNLIYDQLRVKAEEIIKKKTESYTRMGFTLEAQNYSNTQGSVYPMERYVKYLAANTGVPKSVARKSSKDKPVEYNYADKNSTIYYEKVPANQFDLVINADMVEPTVQFYYSLNINYRILLDEVVKREKEDRELDLQLKRAQIQQQIKAAGGQVSSGNVTTQVTVKTK